MVLFDSGPMYNTIIIYILLVVFLLITKPKFMYCKKTGKFKSFGSNKGQTIFCFPLVCFVSIIIIYLVFLIVEILSNYLDNLNR